MSSEPEAPNGRPAIPAESLDFESFYRSFAPRILALISKRTADRQLAEDVMQETFIKVYRYQNRLDPTRPVWPWISVIAINVYSTLLKRILSKPEILVRIGDLQGTDWPAPPGSDPAEHYLSKEHGDIVASALAALRPRYRRILLLKDVEGWRLKDIADVEGGSVESIEVAVRRARKRFKQAYVSLAEEHGFPVPSRKDRIVPGLLLPAFLKPLRWMRRRLDALAGQMQQMGDAVAGSIAKIASAGDGPNWVVAGALVIALASGSAMTPASGGPSFGDHLQAPVFAIDANSSGLSSRNSAPRDSGASVADPVRDLGQTAQQAAAAATDPGSEATPENTTLYGMAASPDYENDHTIFAAGSYSPINLGTGESNVLFISKDGGSSWNRLPAQLFLGARRGLLLSPAYPKDGRIFSVGGEGIQESDDGGQSFRLVFPFPMVDSLYLAKNFASTYSATGTGGHPRFIFVNANTVFEYSYGDTIPKPIFSSPDRNYYSAEISPAYSQDHISLLISAQRVEAIYTRDMHRCEGLVCQKILSQTNILGLRFSPEFARDETAYVYGNRGKYNIFASSDGARTFRPILSQNPFDPPKNTLEKYISGIVVANVKSKPVLFAASTSEIFRLNDDDSWTLLTSSIPVPVGIGSLVSTPSGRLFVTGYKGIYCSEDGGLTWAPRCQPER